MNNKLVILLLICYISSIDIAVILHHSSMPVDMVNDAPVTHGYSLLLNDIVRQRLRVLRGRSAPLLHTHLPIQMRAQKGQVCRVEVEEHQPLLSMVGHLEPKKFDCSFAEGDVIYVHSGNPLTNHDHVQVTIFFFRNNNSVVQTVDIMVDIEQPLPSWSTDKQDGWTKKEQENQTEEVMRGVNRAEKHSLHTVEGRVMILGQINVASLKSTSVSISPEVLRINYDPEHEECRLSYTSPDFGSKITNNMDGSVGVETGSISGTYAPKLGLPLAAGAAVGGVQRWPLFGQVVAFNRSTVYSFDHDCQEALLQGYRYMHRKANGPQTDYIPMQVTIWRRTDNGLRHLLLREGLFIKVTITNGQMLKRPVVRTFRQVNVTHIGGSLSVLPRDSISVPHDAVPGLEYLDVNMTKMQGPLQAQIVNLRDPTRPVTSFRLLDLRRGLIALQLLNYAESLVKVFTITLTVMDPFFQLSPPVTLRIATFLQPVVQMGLTTSQMVRAPSFQVFSLPLFTYTGAVSLIQKHNIQVVGYIDESMVVYTVKPWPQDSFGISSVVEPGEPRTRTQLQPHGSLRLDGERINGLVFGPPHIAVMRVSYVHTGGYEPSIERIPLSISVPSLSSQLRTVRIKRESGSRYVDWSKVKYHNSPNNTTTNVQPRTGRKRGRRRLRIAQPTLSELQLEISIRIVRLYNKIVDGALQSGVLFRVPAFSYLCFSAEDLLTPEALKAVRSDLVNLAFSIKVTPSQGVLLRRPAITLLADYQSHPIQVSKGYNSQQMTMVNEAELAYTDTQRLLEKAQVSEITLEDLEACEVCYVNQRHDRSTDLIGLKQLGRYDFPTVYMNLEIMPPAVVMISERMDPNVFVRVRETAPHVVISSLHLNHVLQPIGTSQTDHYDNASLTESLGSENLVYTITAQPRFTGSSQDSSTHEAGRLVSLNAVTASTHVGDMTLQPGLSTSLRDAQVPSVTHFTQQQVDTGDIVYVPPAKDIGISDKFVVISYTVTGPNDVRLLRRQLRVLILAEDNQTPQIQVVRPLEVQRDEELVLDAQYISITDVDTPTNQLIAKFERLPRYGDISIVLDNSMNTNVSVTSPVVKGRSLPISLFLESKIRYRQSGANVRADDFILSVTDGKQSSPALRVPLHIKPRILQESKWTQLVNNSVLVQENATVPLHPSVFPDSQPDADESAHVDTGAPQYFLIVFPTKGQLVLKQKHRKQEQTQVSQFTFDDVLHGRLSYRHGPGEIGPNAMFDFARIWDFNAGKTFSLNFTLLPINSQPPVVRSEVPLQVKEGDRAMIDQYTLFASDPDTPESDIEFQIINAPRWGHIGIMDETLETAVTTGPAANRSLSKLDLNHTLSFSLQALKEGRVFYVNSLHSGGQESLEDVFSVRAYDGSFNSPHTVELQVAIQPTNDEIPEVRLLKCFSASLGSRHILTPYLFSVSDKDVPRDMLQIRFTQLPTYGNLTVYWQHGEKSVITPQSPPITESYLGMLNLLYVQNASVFSEDFRSLAQESNSLLAVDRFTISVSDGIHVVERQAQILIRTANRNPPEMHLDPSSPEGIVLDGIAWTRLDKTAGGLVIYDSDTTDDDLVLTLFETPKYGVIQRLPRMDGADGIDVMDLVEDAWDIEEAAVGEDQQALARLAIAGSVGGPKAVKTLKQGDKFTKRQLETERIHYVYTGSYQEQVLHDSCVVRLSDGDFTTDPVTLRFHIARATGRAGVQSLRYTPADEMHSWRPLEFADQVMVEKVGRLTEQVTETEENFVMQQMDESQQIDPIQTAAKMSLLDACLTQHTFITPETLVFDVAGSNETIYNKLNCNYKLHLAPSYNYTRGSRQQPMLCGHFVNAENPRQPINHFSSEEVSSGIIAFSAEDCREHVDQIIKVPFEVDIVFPPRSLHATLPIKITKKCRLLPERVKLEPLTILSGTDTPVSTKHLLFSDQDSSPTELIYMIADEYGVGSTTQFGRLQIGDNQTARLFSQYHVDTGQVIFHANTNLDLNPVGRQHVELHLFDAGDLSRVSSNDFYLIQTTERAFKVYKQLGTTEVNPYNERMQYVIDKISNVISIKPIVLEVRTNPMLQTEKFNRSLVMLIQKPPLPNALETIIPSRVGFQLTAENMYVARPDVEYQLIRLREGLGTLYHTRLNRTVTSFLQEDLNRRRIAFMLFDIQDHSYTQHHRERKINRRRRDRPETHDATDEELYFDICSPTDPHTKIHRSLTLQWTRVAFYRPVFRVCGERGLLSIGVQRHGPTEAMLHNSADVYVGMISDTAVDGEDFSLHSQKLLTFQPGEARKYIRVRLHPRSQEGQVRKREFLISLKSPTGAILGRNRQARVVIRNSPKCKDRAYFSPKKNENPVKRDLHYSDVDRGLQILDLKEQPMHADDNGMRTPVQWFSGEQQLTDAQHTVQVEPLSLKEWLATNELPDSQTLSATYQEFIQNRMGKRCLEGWKLFEERCYRSFSDQRLSWMAARRQCESLNAFLTSINHEKHWNWLKGVFRIHGSYWIGLHQPRPGGTWMWHNLERVGFTNWAPEFPVEPRWKKHTSMQRRVFEQENLAFFKDEDSHLSNTHAVSPRNIPLGNKTETKKTKWGPRVCVSINSKSQWQNRPCDRPMKTGYLCMRNPEM